MRWKRALQWAVWLLCLACVGVVAASECLYRAALARVPSRPQRVEGVSLPPLYQRMKWTLSERTPTLEVAPVWLGTLVQAWVDVALFDERPEPLGKGAGLAHEVVRQWSSQQDDGKGPRLRTVERLALAIWLTRHWSADALLTFDAKHTYLVHGLFGMRAGAQVLLGREWSQLDVADMALLLAVEGSPSGRRDPWCHPDWIGAKRDWILGRLRDTGGLAPEEADAALQVPPRLAPRPADWPPCPVRGERLE